MEHNDIHRDDGRTKEEAAAAAACHINVCFKMAGGRRVGHSLPKCVFYRAMHVIPGKIKFPATYILARPKISRVKIKYQETLCVAPWRSVTHTDMQSDAANGQMDRRGAARHMQNLFKAKRTEICPRARARLIFYAGNVTGDLCLLSSGPWSGRPALSPTSQGVTDCHTVFPLPPT